MERLVAIASRIDRTLNRHSTVLKGVGWICFALIAADYANFIDLPKLVTIPLWLAVLLNLFRWAIWEGMIKPGARTSADHGLIDDPTRPRPPAKD